MKYSALFRSWHWLNALVVFGLLATVFLRKTFLSYKANAQIIVAKLADLGEDIELEDAKSIARSIRNVMWEWHLYLGYALVALLLLRLIIVFVDKKSKKEPFNTLSPHKRGVKVLYYILYGVLSLLAISGLVIYLQVSLGLSDESVAMFKKFHEIIYLYVAFFVPIHIVGVFIADIREENGLVSSMINGKELKKESSC